MCEPVCVQVNRVTGIGEDECFITCTIDLQTSDPVFDVVPLTKEVRIDQCEVFCDKVLINGTLHKELLLKEEDDTGGDCATVACSPFNPQRIRCGDVKHLTLDIPFGCCIRVPGARPGDTCQIERAEVDAEKDELVLDMSGFVDSIIEKTCIHVVVRCIRQEQMTLSGEHRNVCPQLPPRC